MYPFPPNKPRRLQLPCLLVLVALLTGPVAVIAATTNFSTGFESADGYTTGQALTAQQGWFGYWFSTNLNLNTTGGAAGNRVINLGLSGTSQAAYVGLTQLPTDFNSAVEQVRFLNLDPNGSGMPMVDFSSKVKIIDSTISFYDYFYWRFYNQDGEFLFAIGFDNIYQRIFLVNNTNAEAHPINISNFFEYHPYSSAVEYLLDVSMNFASNRYSVTWNGVMLTNNLPITISGSALNLGIIAAAWQKSNPSNGANNYMLFDDVQVISSELVPPRPQLKVLAPGGGANAMLRLTGQDGFRFVVEGATNLTAWSVVSTNIISGGKVDFTDPGAVGKPARFYRARWVP